jgi:hypothetical protein
MTKKYNREGEGQRKLGGERARERMRHGLRVGRKEGRTSRFKEAPKVWR